MRSRVPMPITIQPNIKEMRYDDIIIGGGLSGLVSGIALARAGRRVAIISAGQSALHFWSGSFELCGADAAPLDAIVRLEPSHPYHKVGVGRISAYSEHFKELLFEAGIRVTGSAERNHYRLTPIGRFKPAWLSLEDYYSFADAEQMPWNKVLLLGIEGYLDFNPEFVAAGLERRGVECRIEHFSLPRLEALRKSTTEMRAANIARLLTGEMLDQVARTINEKVGDAEAIFMPAVAGLYDSRPMQELRRKVRIPLYFIPTIPASVPGIRTQIQLRNHFQRLGGTYLLGDNVTGGTLSEGRLKSITTTLHEEVEFTAENFILASGSFFSHGLIADTNAIYEPIFGLDVKAPTPRSEWYEKDLYARQPYMSYGVECDAELHPLLGGEPVKNLYAVGSILAGQKALEAGTGAGVAITTALRAADLILENR